jgi:hypothetical protein
MSIFKRSAVAAGLVLLTQSSMAQAQSPAPDAWRVIMAPYLMGAGMSGTAGIGPINADVNMSASDVFSNLQFGFMGYFEAMKGNWGVGSDIIWMALGTSTDDPVPANVDVNQGAFTFLALRRLSPAMELRAGVLINTLQSSIELKAPINRERSRDETWVDPVVGFNLHTPREGKWAFALVADIGGFGVGSDFMFDIMPTARVNLTNRAGLAFGYRWISLDYESDADDDTKRFAYDVVSSGPFAGFVFRF